MIQVVGGKVVPQGLRPIIPTSGSSSSPVQQQTQKVLIRSVQPKTIISTNNVVKIGTESKVRKNISYKVSQTSISSQAPSKKKNTLQKIYLEVSRSRFLHDLLIELHS